MGCTNVGKSSVFNRLVASDYCDVNAEAFVERVTTSPWPGTTLNMLKFPIQRVSRTLATFRMSRTADQRKLPSKIMLAKRNVRAPFGSIRHTTLEEPVGRTLKANSVQHQYTTESTFDVAKKSSHQSISAPTQDVHAGTWCHDTPGVHTSDQILDLLTIDELNLLNPRWIISPKSFVLTLGSTMFLAGIGRMDYIAKHGDNTEEDVKSDFVRCTLFTSDLLPLTICRTTDADEVYEKLLETEAFVIPSNEPERLKAWPELKNKTLDVTGTGLNVSSADITFSSAGWVAIALRAGNTGRFRVWTPEGRGIHLRSPALLMKSIKLRGARIAHTPMYSKGQQVYLGTLVTK